MLSHPITPAHLSPLLSRYHLPPRCFDCVQGLLSDRLVTAGHDRSDGGLLVTLLEMAFAGNCGLDVRLPAVSGTSSSGGGGDEVLRGLVDFLFSEELGLVLEVLPAHEEQVQ